MSTLAILAYAGASVCVLLALTAIAIRRSLVSWLFFLGMAALALETGLDAAAHHTGATEAAIVRYETIAGIIRSFLPTIWLFFSLVYSRGNYREFLAGWRLLLAGILILPVIITEGFQQDLFSSARLLDQSGGWVLFFTPAGKALSLLFLVGVVLALTNLEKTFRTAVGTMRWRIKFVILGLCVIFGAKLYVSSQSLLFSGLELSLKGVESGALLIGCALIAVSYLRSGRMEIDVYPSQSFLYGSITILLTGVYFLLVGALANIVRLLGGDTAFPIKAFFVLVGVVLLAVLLLSDRVKQGSQRFISRHLKRPLYDSHKVWTLFTEKAASVSDQPGLCVVTAKLISDTFNVLSATVWLADDLQKQLQLTASTSLQSDQSQRLKTGVNFETFLTALRSSPRPFDLETSKEPWALELRKGNPVNFTRGGNRICVPIVAGERALGIIILGDRVRAQPFSQEEMDLLRCIGGHVAASLLTIQLSQKLMQTKEEEAFRAVSAFFAHDLKNSASTLSLMLQNLPQHYNDPEFREDVQRGISKTVSHMNHLITRLSALKQKPRLNTRPANLNEVVAGALSQWQTIPHIEFVKDFAPVPDLQLDPEQIQNVVTNLLLNARDAIGSQGRIQLSTQQQNGWAVLTVADSGCGMSEEFLRHSLFRPFQTTKKGGTGIGMFQCKMIVEAHGGKIEVESELGKGTAFHVKFPTLKEAE